RTLVGVAEAGSLEDIVNVGVAPRERIVGAYHDLAGAALSYQVAYALWGENHGIEIQLAQIFRGVFLGALARVGESHATVVGAAGVGGQIATGVGSADFERGEFIQRAIEYQVREEDG